ncbi:LAME_0E02080g1_1 [Lachancea meyersii CBS 8951]|uniref:LAME_0E02080g1_1 n=1 Tax=Lachancea meyersii CBS 8951 TaxID=1266667 RepID=A0A1G4JFR3_9SACH|nr:LAME_0E02080g1_1 [Lachancea meyersii CBS 8951]
MEATNLQIYWHESQPIYSLSFQSSGSRNEQQTRLVTAGGDNKIRVWHLNFEGQDRSKVDTIDFLSSLNQHEQAVNVVRFNPQNDTLASAGDDGQLLLWRKNDTMSKDFGVDDDEFADFKESWYVWKRLRSSSAAGSSEIYDLAWSPDGKFVATGSMDNSVRVFDVAGESCVAIAADHNHYVQGIVWDPQNEFIISQSADRSVHLHRIVYDGSGTVADLKLLNRIIRGDGPCRKAANSTELDYSNIKSSYLFHNETLPSFFRRLDISPCGNLLCLPAGIFKNCDSTSESGNGNDELANAVYVFTRSYLKSNSNKPMLVLPFFKKPALVVSFCPQLYQLSENPTPYVQLPYKLVFAIATSDEVFIYDTEATQPICIIGNLHYTPITDLSWHRDGTMLMVSSTDGFCSYISVAKGSLGAEYIKRENTPIAPPTTVEGPVAKVLSIVNTLPVKRKAEQDATTVQASIQPSNKALDTGPKENASVTGSENKTQGGAKSVKRRVQPTLILQNDKN